MRKGLKGIYKGIIVICLSSSLNGFPNLTRNDQLPPYSTVYPYSYLATRQKANLMRFDYTYALNRLQISVSPYHQFANCASNSERDAVNIGDLNGRWNMCGLFYDPALKTVLFTALGLTDADFTVSDDSNCLLNVTSPQYVDKNQEFGFFSIPTVYKKYGVRFESECLLIDRCWYAVGLRARWGISDVRQTVHAFNDFTCQALGTACPASAMVGPLSGTTTTPLPFTPVPGIAPPYVDPTTVPPCPQPSCSPTGATDCIVPKQPFMPIDDAVLNLGYTADCKQAVITNIMDNLYPIADILGLDICNYHKVGLDDLRLSLFWRHLFLINEDDERYPRLVFMPFAEAGVGIPLSKEINANKPFAVPIGNNGHTYVGGIAGFTIDFLDTLDLTFAGGFSYFFRQDFCNFRMPTNYAESGIFPYAADVSIRPGPTWHFNFGLHAYHFLDNLSFWAEYCITSHAQDKITVCRSFIPENSSYYATGFDVERTECFSKWEADVANVAFNYDLFDCLAIGILWQGPVRQRNAYKSGTYMGSVTFTW